MKHISRRDFIKASGAAIGSAALAGCAQPAPTAAPVPAAAPGKVPGGNNVKVIVTVDHTALLLAFVALAASCVAAYLWPGPRRGDRRGASPETSPDPGR